MFKNGEIIDNVELIWLFINCIDKLEWLGFVFLLVN